MPEQIPVRATRNGGLDYVEVPTREENWIAALRRERQGYSERDDADSVALVDAELARLGAPVDQPARKKQTRGGSQN